MRVHDKWIDRWRVPSFYIFVEKFSPFAIAKHAEK